MRGGVTDIICALRPKNSDENTGGRLRERRGERVILTLVVLQEENDSLEECSDAIP